MKSQQRRATFEDVCKAQNSLLILVNNCIQKNKSLSDNERKKFFDYYRLATLGIGTEFNFVISGKKKNYSLGHVGHAAYWIAFRSSNKVEIGEEILDIKELWLKLRDMLFIIFDHAIETSIKISKEQTRLNRIEAGEV